MKAGPRNGSGQPDYKLDDRDGRGMNGRADERGAGPQHAYRRGDRLPPHAHGDKDVVGDWRAHHLSEPPRGSHWVRTGDDFVLVAITTGVIMELLLNH
jgi:Ni/Co efflux regulator RcnB